MSDKFNRMAKTLPGFYKAESSVYLKGILKAWGVTDDYVSFQLKETKKQLFVQEAEGISLDRLANNFGVERSSELGIGDDDFRQLIPVMATYPKQVRNTLIALFDVFWGQGFTRPNINSGNIEPFNFGTPDTIAGTSHFKKGDKLVKGTGTNYLTDLTIGQFIKPASLNDKHFARVSRIISNTELELSTPWEHSNIALAPVVKMTQITLSYIADKNEEKTIRIFPNAFNNISQAYSTEIADFINKHPEHSQYITASLFLDPLSGNKLNIRTNTAGLSGSIQITGGTANAPSMLNFDLQKHTEVRAAVYEVNPNEIVVQIPSSVPVLRRTLKGAVHPKKQKTAITSLNEPYNFSVLGASSTLNVTVEGTPYVVNFNHATNFTNPARATAAEVAAVINSQLTYLEAFAKTVEAPLSVGLRTTAGSAEYQVTGGTANSLLQFPTTLQTDPDLIIDGYPSSYVFDPNGQLFTVTRINSQLTQAIGEGTTQPTISIANSSEFPNSSGLILFDFGRANQEGPVPYNSRPNNSTLLISASHIFQKPHEVGRFVNLISNKPTIPRVTGNDYPVYVVGTQEARAAAQTLIKKLIASGVVIRFVIDFPEVLFECKVGVSENPDYVGYRSTNPDVIFEC